MDYFSQKGEMRNPKFITQNQVEKINENLLSSISQLVFLSAWNFYLKKFYAEFVLRRKIEQNKDKKIELELQNREAPKILSKEDSFDSQNIFGNDEDGNSLVLKFERRRHRIAEIWMILRLKNGEVYTFPSHPNSVIVNATPRAFEGAGLKLECLVAHSKWRITYSGWMRKGVNEDYSHDDDERLHFVKINFL